MKISKKVILLGHFGVGKTSLVRRFVQQRFSEEYQTTIGVKVDKKEVVIGDHHLTMILWDIEGGRSQQHLPPSYFAGAHGIIYVFDLTRPATWETIDHELSYFSDKLPTATRRIIGNKRDMIEEVQMREFQERFQGQYDYLSSAKTGENVEELFLALGLGMLS
jgi:small GTP-binding protein